MWNDPLALNRLTALLLVVALLVAGVTGVRWFARQPQFAIRTVVVTPAEGQELQHVTAERVARFCVPQINGTIFTADLAQARNAFESLPWVRKASVRRQWPDRLVVRLEEHRALARWNDEAGNRFVSVLGEAFNAPGEAELGRGLPLLSGPEGSARDVARQFGAFRERLATIGKDPRVILDNAGRPEELLLREGEPLPVKAAMVRRGARRTAAAPPNNDAALNQRLQTLNGPGGQGISQILSSARIVPQYFDGQMQGMRVDAIKPDSVFQKVGLQNGDIITEVNGIVIDRVEATSAIFDEFATAEAIDIAAMRGGSTVKLSASAADLLEQH